MPSRTLGIIGATGFIGRELARRAADGGWRVIGFSREARDPSGAVAGWRRWNDRPDLAELEAVVNLAGEPVNKRWTAANRRRFHESRVGVTSTLVRAMADLPAGERPGTLLNGSAVGIYGDRGDEILEESASPSTGYLADLCHQWEAAADPAAELGVRVLKWRIGVVLGRDGDAFRQMLVPFRLGLGGKLGSGKQWMPWIHVEDLVGGMVYALERESLAGPVNGSSPQPERNAAFTRRLAAALHRPAFLPAPAFALRIALGGFASAVLCSERAVPQVLLDAGYEFRFPDLGSALDDLLQPA